MTDNPSIQDKIKTIIINRLNLDRSPDSIANDAVLFGDELGLDSIDSLELIVGLEKEFDIKIKDDELQKPDEIFYSVDTLSAFVEKKLAAE